MSVTNLSVPPRTPQATAATQTDTSRLVTPGRGPRIEISPEVIDSLKQGFTIETTDSGPARIHYKDGTLLIAPTSRSDQSKIDVIIGQTQESLNLGQFRHATDLLVRELGKVGTSYIAKEVTAEHLNTVTAFDKLAAILATSTPQLSQPSAINDETVLRIGNSKIQVNFVNDRGEKVVDVEASKALNRSIHHFLEFDVNPDPLSRAIKLTRLIDTFKTPDGTSISVDASGNLDVLDGKIIKTDLPNSFNGALNVTAAHLLTSKPGEITTSVTKNEDTGAYQVYIGGENAQLVVDIDPRYLSIPEAEHGARLDALAANIKSKAESLWNMEPDVAELSAYINEQISGITKFANIDLENIPQDQLKDLPFTAELSVDQVSAHYNFVTGDRIDRHDHFIPRSPANTVTDSDATSATNGQTANTTAGEDTNTVDDSGQNQTASQAAATNAIEPNQDATQTAPAAAEPIEEAQAIIDLTSSPSSVITFIDPLANSNTIHHGTDATVIVINDPLFEGFVESEVRTFSFGHPDELSIDELFAQSIKPFSSNGINISGTLPTHPFSGLTGPRETWDTAGENAVAPKPQVSNFPVFTEDDLFSPVVIPATNGAPLPEVPVTAVLPADQSTSPEITPAPTLFADAMTAAGFPAASVGAPAKKPGIGRRIVSSTLGLVIPRLRLPKAEPLSSGNQDSSTPNAENE